MEETVHIASYSIGIGESLTGLGVLWPILANYGYCGCGEVHMTNKVAYFTDRELAQRCVNALNSGDF